jgi:hypothetical protein
MKLAHDHVQRRAFVVAVLNLQVLLPESLGVDGTGPRFCPAEGFCTSGVGPSGFAAREFGSGWNWLRILSRGRAFVVAVSNLRVPLRESYFISKVYHRETERLIQENSEILRQELFS